MLKIDAIAQTSALNHINGGLKMLVGAVSLIACITSNTWYNIFFIMLSMVYLTVYVAGVKWSIYIKLLKIPFFFLFLGAAAVLIEISNVRTGIAALNIGSVYFCITMESVGKAVFITYRAFGAVTCLYMISLTTTLSEIIQVLRVLKVPEIVIELMYLIYRYLVILLEIHNNMAISARSRYGYVNRKNTYRTMMGIAQNLLLLSFRKASVSFDAMVSRGYDGKIEFWQNEKRLHKKECIYAGIYFVLLTIIFVLERVL